MYIRELLDSSYQGVKRLFVFLYMRGINFTTENSYDKYLLPRLKIDNCNIEIDGRNFIIHQLMTRLHNTMNSEMYQKDKVMITQLVVYLISYISTKNID